MNVTPGALSFPQAKAKKESTLTKPNCASGDSPGTAVRRARASHNYHRGPKVKLNQGALEVMWSLDTNPKRDGCQLLLGSGRDMIG